MSTLFDALSDGSFDLQNKRDMSGDFGKKLIGYRDRVVSEYLKGNENLNVLISEIAKKENLNDDHISRILEEVNNQVYLIKYDKLKGQNKREVDFELASLSKIKSLIKGDSPSNQNINDTETDKGVSAKEAFETDNCFIEKVASENNSDIFSRGLEYSFGDLSIAHRFSKEEYILKKIANTMSDKEKNIEKIAREINHSIDELAETFIHLERFGKDTNCIMSKLVKEASISDNGIEIIKEAITNKIAFFIEEKYVPESFSVDLENISLDKTASEKFSLGKFSLNKDVDQLDIPNICLRTNKTISNFSDIQKIACYIKKNIDSLEKENNELIIAKEKLASTGVSKVLEEDFFFKTAGINSSINRLKSMIKSVKPAVNSVVESSKPIINNFKESVKTSKPYMDFTGANVQNATTGVNRARNSFDAIKNSSGYNRKNNIVNAANKAINNFDSRPGALKNKENVTNAKNTINQLRIDRKDDIRRYENQSIFKNIFDGNARNANRELKNAQRGYSQAKNDYAKYKNKEISKLMDARNKANEELKKISLDGEFVKHQRNFNASNDIYNKALRDKSRTRIGAAAVPGAVLAKSLLSKKEDNTFE